MLSGPLFAQWVSGGSCGTANNKSSSSSLTFNLGTSVPSGSLLVVCAGYDNVATSDGNQEATTLEIADYGLFANNGTDSFRAGGRHTNGNGASGSGCSVDIYAIVLLTGISTSQNLTLTFSSAITAKAVTCWYFTKSHGSTITLETTVNGLSNDVSDPGSITKGSMSNVEHLGIRATVHESDVLNMTSTSGWTLMSESGTSGGTASTNIEICAEFRIQTTTSMTSDPTWGSADHASEIMVLTETIQATYNKGILTNF